eukprot:TRINITY_DN29096_c1_g2_i2.p1 TRINITY_DN29096_c1_g2~~TRINITY_DN29096_c1_g2_i2.p1  ORF type:complete len:312 (+),score=74.78 TRINITY_DN29096_c1_g2_i2:446-1381(+)
MVGGSTRIPKIQSLLQDFFGLPEPPQHKVNPDEAVAIGAAIQAGLLWRGSEAGQRALEPRSAWEVVFGRQSDMNIVLVDVTPLSVGIEIQGGHMVTLIKRNSLLPTQKNRIFSTVQDQQTSVYIPIYEGEDSVAVHNSKLGEMVLTGLAPAPRGVPQIDVIFRIDVNGILHVVAQDLNTKQAATVSIDARKGRLSEEEIDKMKRKAKRHADQDTALVARQDTQAAFETYIDSLEAALLDPEASPLAERQRGDVRGTLGSARAWLRENPRASVAELQEQRLLLETAVHEYVAQLYPVAATEPASDVDRSFEL